ncbi:MAG: GTPase Era [Bryobacteraceae bacterium]
MPDSQPEPFVSGFVSIVGRPNSGKSTLLNALTGMKLAIVAPKPQTTRTTVQGVVNLPNAQIVFLDTPGIHRPDTLLNRRMQEAVRAALNERDLLLLVTDATLPFSHEDEEAVRMIAGTNTPALLALNKIDRLKDKSVLLELIDRYRSLHEFSAYIPISALTGEGLDILRQEILLRLPPGPAFFPPDYVSDQPERFLAAELIREKILHHSRQEVPHAVAVAIDQWEESDKLISIHATIYVERDGQKAILIGKGGSMMKKIGTEARLEMEHLLGRKVFLQLFVKVRPHWRQDARFLDALDWHSMTGREAE